MKNKDEMNGKNKQIRSLTATLGQSISNNLVYSQTLTNIALEKGYSVLFVDITDYLIYFSHRHRVTGIQRVVHGLLKYIFDADEFRDYALSLCITCPESGQFGQVNISDFYKLHDLIDSDSDQAGINLASARLLKSTAFANHLPKKINDILLIPGGPWATTKQLFLYGRHKKEIGFKIYSVCYDLIPIEYPEFVSSGLTRVFQTLYDQLTEISDGFISISKFTQACIQNYEKSLGIERDPQMYANWRLGDYDKKREDTFLTGQSVDSPEKNRGVINDILKSNFVLVVSTVEPRKNHQGLLMAWRLLSQRVGTSRELPKLVFVGATGWNSTTTIEMARLMNSRHMNIIHLENIDDKVLGSLYRSCQFAIMPSFVEGWGLSISESLMRGKVCITSNTSSMIEAASGVCPLFDPYNTRELSNVLYDHIYGQEIKISASRAQSYSPTSWRDSALSFFQTLYQMHEASTKEPYACLHALSNDISYCKIRVDSTSAASDNSERFRNLSRTFCWDLLSDPKIPMSVGANLHLPLLLTENSCTIKITLQKMSAEKLILDVSCSAGQFEAMPTVREFDQKHFYVYIRVDPKLDCKEDSESASASPIDIHIRLITEGTGGQFDSICSNMFALIGLKSIEIL